MVRVEVPKFMRGICLTGHGGYEKLEYRKDLPVPAPGNREVLIRVHAAGVNNTDINTRVGWYSKNEGADDDASWAGEPIQFPRIQGIDVCGDIIRVGKNVNPSRIGERVLVEPCLRENQGKTLDSPWFLGSECDGGFAEYVAVSSRHAHRVKSGYSSIELASFPCSYSTAENMLIRSAVGTGDMVLITGASGGVGSAGVQLAQARGAEVIAVTSPLKSQGLLNIGADRAVSGRDGLLSVLDENSMDVVLDLVGGEAWPDLLQVLKPGGYYAVSGAIGGPIVPLDLRTLYLKDLTFCGCTVLDESAFPNLIRYIENKRIRPLVAEVHPLEDIVEAQKSFVRKKHVGKIVLSVTE
ncbi:alcohol dehydrogenase family protein [Candidatus Haliotispira prima]|uniref:Alcohol dehydrogenase family protein n=1 Tax=Candidatus Haliotispira prima TaxID=3034016 RepID=A0ABY8MJL2_9SPIO|nr:alcohol dehydrogenase family protein [Candidatus Haliotispira prima]